ncbi:MAG: hypothetical protein ACI8RD_013821 [Bacillariaceae sp.]|jgi:hypothetical protein
MISDLYNDTNKIQFFIIAHFFILLLYIYISIIIVNYLDASQQYIIMERSLVSRKKKNAF